MSFTSAMTPRRTFLKNVAIAGAALPAGVQAWQLLPKAEPAAWQVKNRFFALNFDVETGAWQARHKETPLVLNAFSSVLLGDGSRQTTDSGFRRTAEVRKFTDLLGSGQLIKVHCADVRQQLNIEVRFWAYNSRESLVIETVCTNVSQADMIVPQINLETGADGCFWPGITRVLTNGQMYYDAGRVLDFKAGSEIRSWWNVGLFAAERHEGLTLGYLENQSAQGRIRIAPVEGRDPGRFQLTAESAYERDFVLKPGKSISSDRFVFNFAADSFLALETYAQAIGDLHQVKLNAPVNGWCSWFSVFGSVTEAEVIRNAQFAAKHLKPFGFEFVQVDDGFYRAFGDWEGNARFPHGMKWLAEKIRSLGLRPGIWLAPYAIAAGTPIHRGHPEWLVHHADGRLKQIGPGLVEGSKEAEQQNPKLYALDITHPAAAEWLQRLFHKVAHEWGYEFIKIDFVEWTLLAADRYYDPTYTKAAIYRRGVEIMRQAIGPKCHLLDCGPGNVSVGLIDSMRIELDQPPVTWQQYYLHPASSGPAAAKRYYFHQRTWVNDDDHVFLANLSPGQAQAATTIVSLSGGNMIAGDRLPDLDPIRLEILKKGFPAFGTAARPIDLFESDKPEVFALKVRKPFGEWIVLGIFNGDPQRAKTKQIALERLGLSPSRQYVGFDFWNQRFVGVLPPVLSLHLEPSSVVLLAIHPQRDQPFVISTDRHISQGGVEVEDAGWDPEARIFHGACVGGAGTAYNIFVYVPEKQPWQQTEKFFFHDFPGYTLKIVDEHILRIHARFDNSSRVAWRINFSELFG